MAEEKRKGAFLGLIFVGCLFIGLAVGNATGRPDVGILAGLGAGFFLMGLLWILVKR